MSVRALAASALGSRLATNRFPDGFLAVDYFGDTDLLSLETTRPIRVLSLSRDCGRRRGIAALARAALDLDWRWLVYAGGLENHPALIRRLERHGGVLGNGSSVVESVRDPGTFFSFLRRAGIPHPPTFVGAPRPSRAAVTPCLWKPIRSGGGARVRRAAPGEPRPRGFYRQVLLAGAAGSAAFVADGERATLLGVSEQLAGFRPLGGEGLRYGGNIAGPWDAFLSADGVRILAGAAAGITRRFGLRGLNGLDYILADGMPHIIEVNPRYTASMELYEELAGTNLFDLHLEALRSARLPAGPLAAPRFLAKGILYARRGTMWRSPGGLRGLDIRDRPMEGEIIDAGHPICTLVVSGDSPAECRHRLETAGRHVRRDLPDARQASRARARRPAGYGPAAPPAARRTCRSVLR